MKKQFKTWSEAFEYWQDYWYSSGKGYEGRGSNEDHQMDICSEWIEENEINVIDIYN